MNTRRDRTVVQYGDLQNHKPRFESSSRRHILARSLSACALGCIIGIQGTPQYSESHLWMTITGLACCLLAVVNDVMDLEETDCNHH